MSVPCECPGDSCGCKHASIRIHYLKVSNIVAVNLVSSTVICSGTDAISSRLMFEHASDECHTVYGWVNVEVVGGWSMALYDTEVVHCGVDAAHVKSRGVPLHPGCR